MITTLQPNEVFVFGSNSAGIHGAGAAKYAHMHFGAEYGVGHGPTGRCYAIPTKDRYIRTLPLIEIKRNVICFLIHASINKDRRYLVTPIGCGLAGYTPDQIAPFFEGYTDNVVLPEEFIKALRP